MTKWFKLFGQQYLGFWVIGLVLFALQELPYVIMPWISLDDNPIMHMREASPVLNICEKVLGVSCIVIMCFVVQKNVTVFTIGSGLHKVGFLLAGIFLLTYYLGWVLYFSGHQSLTIMLAFLVAMPPLYYASIGLWRENWLLLGTALAFGIIHVGHVYGNFKV